MSMLFLLKAETKSKPWLDSSADRRRMRKKLGDLAG